jgi:hypothetical protein
MNFYKPEICLKESLKIFHYQYYKNCVLIFLDNHSTHNPKKILSN